MGQQMPFTPTADERGFVLPGGGALYFETPAAALGADGDRLMAPDGSVHVKSGGAWAAVGGGGGGAFAVGPQGAARAFSPVSDNGNLSTWDATALQASDPTKPALVVLSGSYAMTYAPGKHAASAIQVYQYPAKPVLDHSGATVQTVGQGVAAGVATGTPSDSALVTVPIATVFVLPIGWWAVLSLFPGSDAGANASFSCQWVDYPLG